jgi:hypothetical protein
MKLLKIVFLLSFLVSPLSYSQWWVSGGNLLWPYGDVTIKSNLNVDGTVNGAKYYNFLFTHSGDTTNPSVTDLFNNIGEHSTWERISAGKYRTTFSDVSFNNTRVLNTVSVVFDNGDTQVHYLTYTSGSYLYIQVNKLSDITAYDLSITRLPISITYYP